MPGTSGTCRRPYFFSFSFLLLLCPYAIRPRRRGTPPARRLSLCVPASVLLAAVGEYPLGVATTAPPSLFRPRRSQGPVDVAAPRQRDLCHDMHPRRCCWPPWGRTHSVWRRRCRAPIAFSNLHHHIALDPPLCLVFFSLTLLWHAASAICVAMCTCRVAAGRHRLIYARCGDDVSLVAFSDLHHHFTQPTVLSRF